MGGSGGGASGSITWPAHLTQLHSRWLDNSGGIAPATYLVSTLETAFANSPFTGSVAYDPDVQITRMDNLITALATMLGGRNFTGDWTTASVTALSAFPILSIAQPTVGPLVTTLDAPSLDSSILDTSTLDFTTLDTTTLDISTLDHSGQDSIVVTDADIAQDMAALDAVLQEELEDEVLPRFAAGMLNIGAVNTSAFKVGEALLRGKLGNQVSKHGSELRIELNKQAREINARHQLSFRELEARHLLSFRDIEAKHRLSFRDIEARHYLANRDIEARHKLSFRELEARHKLAFQDITARFKLTFQEIEARYKISFKETQSRLNIAFQEMSMRALLQYEELLFKIASSSQDVRRLAIADMLSALWKQMETQVQYVHQANEAIRVQAVLKKEEKEEQLAIDESDAKWDAELFRYAANFLAAPSGGVTQGNEKKSKAVSALGGALTGAATGAAIGTAISPGAGTAIGAAGGALLGAASAFL